MSNIPAQTFDGVSIPSLSFYSPPTEFYIDTSDKTWSVSGGEAWFFNKRDSDTSAIRTIIAASSDKDSVCQVLRNNVVDSSVTINLLSYTYDNKQVWYGSLGKTFGGSGETLVNVNEGVMTGSVIPRAAWLAVYGGYTGYNVSYDLVGCVGDAGNPTNIPPDAAITNARFIADSDYSFYSGSCWIDGTGYPTGNVHFNFQPETGLLKIGPIASDITIHVHCTTDPYSNIDGESEIPGGGVISVPSLPGLTATSTGIIGLFAPSAAQMQLLADYMWTDFGGTGSTTEDILKEIVQALKRSISNPLDYVIGLNIIPSSGLAIGGSSNIRFGFVNSNVSMPRLTNQYFTVDCGSLSFDALCGDTFLDYAPYSKFSIYLPYIGVKVVDANDFVGHTISVMYRGDVVTGGVTAYILKDGSVMYQYSGCCALNVPLSADGWGSTIAGAVQIATSMVTGGFVGGAAGAVGGALKGVASVAANPSLLSPQVMHSGAVSGGAGCMGVQYPFVIREAVRFHSTNGFNTMSGYPSYYYKSLSNVQGFTTCLDVHLINIPGTQNEVVEIERLLKEGVVF